MRRRAFTLIELLAAAALSAVLMLTVLTVVAGIGRERRAAAQRAKAEVPEDLTEVIRWDLVNTRELRTSRGRAVLTGMSALDTGTRASHRPVEVSYEVSRAGGRSWLVRRQRAEGGNSVDELVCADVARFALTPLGEDVEVRPRAATRPATGPTSRPSISPNVAARVRMQLVWDDPSRPPIDQILVLR